MKKYIYLFVCLLLLIGCSESNVNNKEIKILAPSGAPAISLVEYINQKGSDNVTIVEGSDLLQTALVNDEYDVIIAPINLGCKLISTGSSNYILKGVISWGNLYYVENTELTDGELALFGQSSVVGRVASDLLDTSSATWYSAVSEVSAALLSSKAKYGLLAEPVLSVTLNKAKENGINLEVIHDLNTMYSEKYSILGYPQAALFVKEDSDQINELVECVKSVNKESMNLLENNEDFYGVNNYKLIYNAFDKMNVKYKDVNECTKEIETFLKMFDIEYK